MTKADIAREISLETGLTLDEALAAADAFLGSVRRALLRDDRVELRGFGTFSTTYRAPRTGRNPRTGVVVPIPRRRAVHFRPVGALKRLPLETEG